MGNKILADLMCLNFYFFFSLIIKFSSCFKGIVEVGNVIYEYNVYCNKAV